MNGKDTHQLMPTNLLINNCKMFFICGADDEPCVVAGYSILPRILISDNVLLWCVICLYGEVYFAPVIAIKIENRLTVYIWQIS